MRAATNKPAWYQRRGLPVPAAVIQHRIEMLRRKQMRTQTAADLATMRAEYMTSMQEMRAEGAIEDEEIPGLTADIQRMPLVKGFEPNHKGKRTPHRKEYPSGTERVASTGSGQLQQAPEPDGPGAEG